MVFVIAEHVIDTDSYFLDVSCHHIYYTQLDMPCDSRFAQDNDAH